MHGSISKGNMFLNFNKCEIWNITCYDQSIHLYIHCGKLKWTNPLHTNCNWYFPMHWLDQSYALTNKCNNLIQRCFTSSMFSTRSTVTKIWNIAKLIIPTRYRRKTQTWNMQESKIYKKYTLCIDHVWNRRHTELY